MSNQVKLKMKKKLPQIRVGLPNTKGQIVIDTSLKTKCLNITNYHFKSITFFKEKIVVNKNGKNNWNLLLEINLLLKIASKKQNTKSHYPAYYFLCFSSFRYATSFRITQRQQKIFHYNLNIVMVSTCFLNFTLTIQIFESGISEFHCQQN